MSDPVTIERKDLFALVDRITDRAISETLKAVGMKGKDVDPSISQNAAVKLLKDSGSKRGLPALRKAMFDGRVRWEKKGMENARGRIYVKTKDVLKLINQ